MRRHEQPDHTESTALPAIQNRATNSTDSRYQDRSFASDDGRWRLDGGGGGGPAPDPVPVTTIAWRLGHLGGMALGGFAAGGSRTAH